MLQVITNTVSVDYLSKPVEVFKEMHRVLKPGGKAIMSFSNRCFPTKGDHLLRHALRATHIVWGSQGSKSHRRRNPMLLSAESIRQRAIVQTASSLRNTGWVSRHDC